MQGIYATREPRKYLFVLLGALLSTCACFYLMLFLISTELSADLSIDNITYVSPSFHQAKPEQPEPVRAKPAKVLPTTPPPDPAGTPWYQIERVDLTGERLTFGSIADLIGPEDMQLELTPPHSELAPLHVVQPIYPLRAVMKEIEGYVVVEFSVRENGTVTNPVVIQSEPEVLFDQAALSAISRFKFQPRTVGGDEIQVDKVQLKFAFNLESMYGVEEARP